MYDILQLNQKTVTELKEIAKELDIKKYQKLKKEDLVYTILDQQAIKPGTKVVEKKVTNSKPKAEKKDLELNFDKKEESKKEDSKKVEEKKDEEKKVAYPKKPASERVIRPQIENKTPKKETNSVDKPAVDSKSKESDKQAQVQTAAESRFS